MRRKLQVLALSGVLLLTACGGSLLTSLRAALTASTPLVNSLVASGAIPQSKATVIVQDFTQGADCAMGIQSEFKLIPSDDPEKRLKKLNASVKGMRCFRVIMDRQNFAAHPKVQTAANIADGIFASLVVFYSEPGEFRADAARGRTTVAADDERQLERKLKAEVERLEDALQP
jgi:hypothetical protein